jgi:hypothetical protein
MPENGGDGVSEKDLALEALLDFFDAVEAGIAQAKQRIKNVKVPEKFGWDPNKIKWTQAEGTSGPYERSEDVDNLDFKAMLKDLAEHKGKFQREGYFYWVFQRASVVGRKQVKKKE